MRNHIFILFLILIVGCNSKQSENEKDSFPVLKGKYLGQQEPGQTPELFAPNIVSTGMSEINAAFSPDFKEFLNKLSGQKKTVRNSRHAFTIKEKDLIPEGMAYDPIEKAFYFGSIQKCKVIKVGPDGKAEDFIKQGQDGLVVTLGMKVDVKRRI